MANFVIQASFRFTKRYFHQFNIGKEFSQKTIQIDEKEN